MTDLTAWGVPARSDSAAEHYRVFAEHEAHGSSEVYEEWAASIAGDSEVLARIDALPRPKRQANLVFAAARVAGVPVGPWAAARPELLARWPQVREVAMTHATQTNEAARCAVLLPVLSALPGPLALLEVGASAGLCLYPDRYSYRYRTDAGETVVLEPSRPTDVVIDCDLSGTAPPPRLPEVAWRGGVDLHPLDAADPATVDWLEALIWPEHGDRRDRLRAAARVAAADPVRLHAGDLSERLDEVAASAPLEATLVVFHTAVLAYLTPDDRARFAERVAALAAGRDGRVVWVSNEGLGVLPEVRDRLPAGAAAAGDFVLAVDGMPVAITHPHGRTFRAVGRSAIIEG